MDHNTNTRTRLVVEAGLVIALAVVLNALTLWQMPQGGSVSLVMLPILVYALRRGVWPGLAAGALYGVVDALLKPFVVHPAQFFLDYPLAYGLVGLAGVFSAVWTRDAAAGRFGHGTVAAVVPGILLGTFARYAAHVVSGVVYFSEYAGDSPVLAYSLAYNSFVLVSAIGCLAVGPVLLRAIPLVEARSRR
jgi:thiamine transporter